MRFSLVSLFFLVFLSILDVGGQNLNQVNIYKKGLGKQESDAERVERFWKIAFHYSQVYPDSGLPYAKRAMLLAQESHNRKGLAESANIAGLCLSNAGRYEEAEKYLSFAVGLFRTIGDPCLTTVAMGNRGWNYYHQHQFSLALEQFFDAEQLDRKCPSRGWKSTTYYNIGVAYNALKEFDKAIPYFEQAIQADLQTRDSIKLATSVQGKANALRDLSRYAEARQHYNLALSIYAKLPDKYALAYVYENLAELELGLGNYQQAATSAEKALSIFILLERFSDAQYEHSLLSKIYLQGGEFGQAESHAKQALQLAQRLKDPFSLKDAYGQLSAVQEKMGDFKSALSTHKRENAIRDSLNEADQQKIQAELAAKYESEKKDRLIEKEQLRSSVLKQSELEARREKRLWLFGALVALFIAGLIALRWQDSRKTAAILRNKNQQIAIEKENAQRSEESKQLFLSTMSHELRNPLSAMLGILRLLNTQPLSVKDSNYMVALRNLSGHMQRVVDDILDSAQLEAGLLPIQKNAFNPAKALVSIENVYRTLAEEKGLEFCFEQELPTNLNLMGDKSRWLQILHNLLSNALKFTQAGKIRFSVKYENNILFAAVQDNGPGIPIHFRHKLFEPFQQAEGKTGSSGLGLSISKRIALLLGGDLIVVSEQQQGARFELSIPMERTTVVEPNEQEFLSVKPNTEGHVLIVEDDPYAWMVARDTLKKYFPQVNVHHFESAEGVVEELEADDYDLVFLDIHMPGVSGLELSKQLRKLGHQLPLYAFTASVTPTEIQEYLEAGITGIVPKPFHDRELINVINKHLSTTATNDHPPVVMHLDRVKALLAEYLPKYIDQAEEAFRRSDYDALDRCFHSVIPFFKDCGFSDLALRTAEMSARTIEKASFEQWLKEVKHLPTTEPDAHDSRSTGR